MHSTPSIRPLRGEILIQETVELRQAMAEAVITLAAKTKDWPLLHEAVDIKIQDQRDFVAIWDRRVRSPGNPNLIVSDQETISAATLEAQTGISKLQTSRWRKSLQDPEAYHDKLVLAACRKAGLEPEENHRAEGTGENEWFTPELYIEAAHQVMGGIDLDPASHPAAQRTVQARQFYTKQDDGLSLSWHGKVWLNPPYAQPYITQFVTKLCEELPGLEQAIMLTHNYTDTTWFHLAEARADLLCFTRGRIRFIDISGSACAPTQGQCFFYFGSNRDDFRTIFSQFGFVR